MKKILYTLLTLSFLDVLGFSFILPVLPFIVKDFNGGASTVGIVVSSAALGMLLGGIFFGRLSDEYGRKKMILISIALNIVGYILFGLSKNLEMFIISRFICGLGGGGISVVQAYIGDISEDKNRVANMGLIGASIGLGFTLGPIFGATLEGIGLRNMGFISAFILFVSLIISYKNLGTDTKKHHEIITLKNTPENLLILFISFFVITAAFAGIQTIFALYLNDIFEYGPKQVAYTFGFLGIIAIIYQGLLIGKINRYIGEKKMILSGLIFIGLGFVIMGKSENLAALYIILAFVAIGLSNVNSSIYSLISKHSHKKDFGKNMGINTAFGSVADTVGPFVSGFLYGESFRFPFYFFGLMLLFNIIFVYFLLERNMEKNNISNQT